MSDSNHERELSLYDAFMALKTVDECGKFLKDLCTPQELSSMKERWRVCQLLAREDRSYREIHDKTGVSLATIGRVARFLREESYGGYRLLLERCQKRGVRK